MAYPKLPYTSGKSTALLHCGRMQDAIVRIRPELPGNIIVIHGVNDVGTSFGAVEKGLCQGLDARMYGGGHVFTPAAYRLPQEADKRETIADPRPLQHRIPEFGAGMFGAGEREQVEKALNLGKKAGDRCSINRVSRHPGGGDRLRVDREETPNEARKRWQNEVSPKSFHGAIIGNAENHRNVTAYDVAIGSGKASSDPRFYEYLCAVADWRLQGDIRNPVRPSIPRWNDFKKKFAIYLEAEPAQRQLIIKGNADYYSSGVLPAFVPALQAGLPSTVVCETINGRRTESVVTPVVHKPSDDIPK